jgi:NO-binding membrane sensor protein with MHYT domain
MGAAIAIMHYTGMAAATFVSTTLPLTLSDTAHAVKVSSLSISLVVLAEVISKDFGAKLPALLSRDNPHLSEVRKQAAGLVLSLSICGSI